MPNTTTTEYVLRIGPEDRYRHTHKRLGRHIVSFRVQYETLLHGEWRCVARYDTAHGFAHRDLMGYNGAVEKTPLFNQDVNEAWTFAEDDLKTNWVIYKRRFLEGAHE